MFCKGPCSQGKYHAHINLGIGINAKLANVELESEKLTGKFISFKKKKKSEFFQVLEHFRRKPLWEPELSG